MFSQLPLGVLAHRINLLSAFFGAGGVVAVFLLMKILFVRWLPALISAFTLGLAGQWWSHASVAQPYSAVPLIIAVLLIMLLFWRRGGSTRLVWGGAFIYGAGLAFHPSLLYFFPVLVAGVFVLGPWRQLLGLKPVLLVLISFAAGLSFYLYLPIRSATDPAILYQPIDSLSTLYSFVTVSEARSTGTFATTIPGQEELGQRLSEVVRQGFFPSYAFLVFAPIITLLYPAVLRRLKPYGRELLFLAAGAFTHMAIIFSISGVYVQYYLPILLYFSMWAGFSVFLIIITAEEYLGSERLKQALVVATGAIYLGVLALGLPTIWPFVDHRQDRSMREFADYVFSQAPPGAVVLANWESYSGLIFAQKVDGQRQDLHIVSVPPAGWRGDLSDLRGRYPESEFYLARTMPFDDTEGTTPIGPFYLLSIKGRTFQDLQHGMPFPATVQMYRVAGT